MNERPILFSGEMVRAILDGRKTMTRRVIVPPRACRKYDKDHRSYPGEKWWVGPSPTGGYWAVDHPAGPHSRMAPSGPGFPCPYGSPGERLWVRECFGVWHDGRPSPVRGQPADPVIIYRADDEDPPRPADEHLWEPFRWRSPRYMPRWASRINLEVVRVRVERLQEISGVDAVEEGCGLGMPSYQLMHYGGYKKARHAFRELWDTLNAKRGHPWESNPWVWIVGFRRVEP